MKNIIKKSITTVIIMALALTLAMPVAAQAAKKKAPKISKTKVTMILSILVDTFFARIIMLKLQSPEIRNISAA
ncbi:hypothetical protein D3Z38_09165 [Clostridiales bacterium]|nr:hypothetical protein [Clostridiales bacterium]